MNLDKYLSRVNYSSYSVYILAALYTVTLGVYAYCRHFDIDEFEAIHTAWKMYQGQTIYVDFFQHHHPLLYYFLQPLFWFFGSSISVLYAARGLQFLFLILIFVTVWSLSKYFGNTVLGGVTILFLATNHIFVKNAIEVRPDVPQLAFCLLGLLFLYRYVERPNISYLVLSTLSISCAYLFLQKTIFFGALYGSVLLYYWYSDTISTKAILISMFVGSLPILFFMVYVVYAYGFSTYVLLNWWVNIYHPDPFLPFGFIAYALKTNMLFWFFYAMGAFFYVRTTIHKQIVVISTGLLLSLFLVKHPWPQYFMPIIPLASLIAAWGITQMFKHDTAKLVTAVFFSTIFPWLGIVHGTFFDAREQLEKVTYVIRSTKDSDMVFDGINRFNLFRHDVDYFWFASGCRAAYKHLVGYEYDIYEIIKTKKPKIINMEFLDNNHPVVHEFYKALDMFRDIYILKD